MAEKIAVLGAGIMGGIWIERLLAVGAAAPENTLACDPNAQRLEELRARYGIGVSRDNREGARWGEVIILAPPPAAIVPLLDEIAAALGPDKLVLSLAAAVPLATLQHHVPEGTPVVRVMPNTPSLVGAGVNPVAFSPSVDSAARNRVLALLQHLGETFEVTDEQMNVVCALCAVGPTYLLPVVEVLAASAAQRGLPLDTARRATALLTAGVGVLLRDTARPPEELQQMISLRTLDENAVRETFQRAFEEAYARLEALQSKLAER